MKRWRNKNAVPDPPLPEAPETGTRLLLSTLESRDFAGALKLLPAVYAQWWLGLVQESPHHVFIETMLGLFILYLIFPKKRKSKRTILTTAEMDELINDWEPSPLVPDLPASELSKVRSVRVVENYAGNQVKLRDEVNLKMNFVTMDFLGMSSHPELKDFARETLDEYGCGSCGPRGFYGSLIPHIEIEQEVARFMGTEGAISYSDTASTVTSTLPAFAKKGDLILLDSGVHEAIQVGADLSRAKIIYFDHNNMIDLERKLEEVKAEDHRLRRDATKQRRFIVTEALSRTYGDLAPLKTLVELKVAYGYRLFLDESLSFGTLGTTGKGLTEHTQVPVEAVDMLTVSMAYSLASIGGLCIGNMEVVDHQRLSGAGYCFSAAAPPFVSRFAREALLRIQREPQLLEHLHKNAQLAVQQIQSKCKGKLKLLSDPASPLLVATLDGPASKFSFQSQREMVTNIVKECAARDVLISSSEDNQGPRMPDNLGPKLRFTIRSTFSDSDVTNFVAKLSDAFDEVMHDHESNFKTPHTNYREL